MSGVFGDDFTCCTAPKFRHLGPWGGLRLCGRNRLGGRLGTGLAVFDTLLPLVRGQRIGLFAGSGSTPGRGNTAARSSPR